MGLIVKYAVYRSLLVCLSSQSLRRRDQASSFCHCCWFQAWRLPDPHARQNEYPVQKGLSHCGWMPELGASETYADGTTGCLLSIYRW
jgi:hypothetical protein